MCCVPWLMLNEKKCPWLGVGNKWPKLSDAAWGTLGLFLTIIRAKIGYVSHSAINLCVLFLIWFLSFNTLWVLLKRDRILFCTSIDGQFGKLLRRQCPASMAVSVKSIPWSNRNRVGLVFILHSWYYLLLVCTFPFLLVMSSLCQFVLAVIADALLCFVGCKYTHEQAPLCLSQHLDYFKRGLKKGFYFYYSFLITSTCWN